MLSKLFLRSFLRVPSSTKITPVQGQSICTSLRLYENINIKPPNVPIQKKSPITWYSITGGLALGAGLLTYMYYLRELKDMQLAKERKRQIGKAAIGGKFELVNSEGKLVKSDDFLGKWVMIYFGFTHCPDICPDELEKLSTVVDRLGNEHKINVQPIFISVDPSRDTPEIVGKYIKEFSDKILGLTGSVDQVAQVCKAYRIYFSYGAAGPDDDYIVDHSIIIYLIDPDGGFVDYYGQSHDADKIISSVLIHKLKFDKLQREDWLPSISLKGLTQTS